MSWNQPIRSRLPTLGPSTAPTVAFSAASTFVLNEYQYIHSQHTHHKLSSTVIGAMHTMQLLLRQPLRSGLALIRPSCQRSFLSSLPPKKPSQNPASRQGSICLQCRFRTQSRKYSSPIKPENEFPSSKPTPELENLHTIPEASRDFASATVNNEGQQATESIRLEQRQDSNISEEDNLPSDAERRRSQLSKKFTELMDNIQGNVFIAGQKLNDLTGYSGIEKLKRDIETQGISSHVSLQGFV